MRPPRSDPDPDRAVAVAVAVAVADADDFDALYRGDGATFGDTELPIAPWRLDEEQPIVAELADAGLADPVLECGCGLGENALALAARGYRVTAVDVSPTAIERCRAVAAERGLDVRFLVADATTLEGLPTGFASVLDSALLHCLTPPQRRAYLHALARVSAPGATLQLLCCDEQVPAGMPIPGGLDETELRDLLSPDWRIEGIRRRRYTVGLSREQWSRTVVPLAGPYPPDLDRPDAVDDRGRVLLPIWHVSAVRS